MNRFDIRLSMMILVLLVAFGFGFVWGSVLMRM